MLVPFSNCNRLAQLTGRADELQIVQGCEAGNTWVPASLIAHGSLQP